MTESRVWSDLPREARPEARAKWAVEHAEAFVRLLKIKGLL